MARTYGKRAARWHFRHCNPTTVELHAKGPSAARARSLPDLLGEAASSAIRVVRDTGHSVVISMPNERRLKQGVTRLLA